jgi:hypothetical protein
MEHIWPTKHSTRLGNPDPGWPLLFKRLSQTFQAASEDPSQKITDASFIDVSVCRDSRSRNSVALHVWLVNFFTVSGLLRLRGIKYEKVLALTL